MHDTLIEELRDIDTPEAPSPWPPAPGWWALGLLFIFAAFLVYRAWAARRNRNAYRREARTELERIREEYTQNGDPRRYASHASELARRVAIEIVGRGRASRPTGSEFVALLDNLSDRPLSKETAMVLVDAAYRPQLDFDVARVHDELLAWLEELVGHRHA